MRNDEVASYLKFFLAIGLIAWHAGVIHAQQTDAGTQQWKDEQNRDVLDRLQRGQYPVKYHEPIKLESEKTHTLTFETKAPDHAAGKCQTEIAITYLQFDTRARVDASIDNEDCGASSGQYKIQFRVVDANGESREIEHMETWARDDETAIESRNYYDIGENVELIRAIPRAVSCTCAPEQGE